MPVVKDRMAEFKSQAPPGEKIVRDADDDDEEEDDEDEEVDEDPEEDMKEFYSDVADIKQGLMRFKANVDELDRLCTAQIAKGKQNEKDQVERLLGETNQLANILRNKLKAMKEQINELNNDNPSANIRIRVNIQQTLTKRFLELMQQYQEVQTSFESNFRAKIKRQVEVIHPGKSPEEVDEMITRGEVSNLLEGNVMQDKRDHSEAAMALMHLKEQHHDIVMLEQSIIELHQIFVDMATLIEAQDELVDQIEWNCEQASAWTGEAVKELKSANLYVKKHRKRCCGCCACCQAVCASVCGGVSDCCNVM